MTFAVSASFSAGERSITVLDSRLTTHTPSSNAARSTCGFRPSPGSYAFTMNWSNGSAPGFFFLFFSSSPETAFPGNAASAEDLAGHAPSSAATRATRSARTAAQGGKFPKRIAWFFRNNLGCTFFREVFSCGLVWRVVSYGAYSRDGASRATWSATQTSGDVCSGNSTSPSLRIASTSHACASRVSAPRARCKPGMESARGPTCRSRSGARNRTGGGGEVWSVSGVSAVHGVPPGKVREG
mmetsp:Transcript_4262/g.18090  ORF Transcript_4262/g.18090 Transcript_4262/m.18090 type:complete len:241 (+) Transcript_4262:407-1129(+)